MIDLTPLDVRKKKGDFRRTVRGYDPELVDDFLDMVAERLEELVKQNVALTERAEHLQEQVASFREREKALNEALVTAQQLRSEAQDQADREVELIRREAQAQAERIVEEGHRSYREAVRELESLNARRRQFIGTFRMLLERYLADLELEDARLKDDTADLPKAYEPPTRAKKKGKKSADKESDEDEKEGEDSGEEKEWLSSLVGDGEQEDKD